MNLCKSSFSCILHSSDPEASLPLEVAGGQQGQLFNLATVAVGLKVPNVRRLSVSGCGLVAASALQKVDLQDRLGEHFTFAMAAQFLTGSFCTVASTIEFVHILTSALKSFFIMILMIRPQHLAESSNLVSTFGVPSAHVL